MDAAFPSSQAGHGPAPRIQTILHNKAEVMVMNFENATREEKIQLQLEIARLLEQLADHSVLLLNNLTGGTYDPQAANSWKPLAELFERKVRKSAVYGASAIAETSIAGHYNTAKLVFGIDRNERGRVFASRKEALDWLAR